MDNAFTLLVLLLAVVCVMAATRPSRPTERSRPAPPDQVPPPDPPDKATPSEAADAEVSRSAAPRRWDRHDLSWAFATDLVAPGAEREFWPVEVAGH